MVAYFFCIDLKAGDLLVHISIADRV